jgi:hypothetical protein
VTSIFSTISGQFGKAWILGAMLPVALFTVFGLIIVQPLLPDDWQVFGSLDDLNLNHVLAVTVWTILASGLLFHLNGPLVRMYEGYPWERGWIGRRRAAHYTKRYRAVEARWHGMRTLIRGIGSDDERYEDIQREWIDLGEIRMKHYPAEDDHVLPTRLGNVIRSFEEYPRRQYGIDSIALWPHLLAVIDPVKAAAIEDEKVAFDFMLNCTFLLKVLAFLTLAAGIPVYLVVDGERTVPLLWLAEVVGLLVLAYLFYLGTINRADGWGSAVRAAFEVNRSAMLERLGYATPSPSIEAERERWRSISQHILFGDEPRGFAARFRGETFALGVPRNARLEVTRSVRPATKGAGPAVVVRVVNVDARPASRVWVTDTVPDGYDYEADSARLRSLPVEVRGLNPFAFAIGDLAPDEESILVYRLARRG